MLASVQVGTGSGGPKRGVAVAKFLNNLTDKKDQLKRAVNKAASRVEGAFTDNDMFQGGSSRGPFSSQG